MNTHQCPKHGKESCDIFFQDRDTHHQCTNLDIEERFKEVWKE